jgi:hypothetical protein
MVLLIIINVLTWLGEKTMKKEHEDFGIIVKDMDQYIRRMEKIQSRIDAANMLGIDTVEYEKRAARPVHLGRGFVVGDESDEPKVMIHTIQQSNSKDGNRRICLDVDVWTEK